MAPELVTKKVWGMERTMFNYPNLYCMKFLDIAVGGCSSLHYHKLKTEDFYVDEGEGRLEIIPIGGQHPRDTKMVHLNLGDIIHLPPLTAHRFWVPLHCHMPCRLIEVSSMHSDQDVYRLEGSKVLTK